MTWSRATAPAAMAALILLLCAAPARACSACKDTGRIPCRKHEPPTAFRFLHSVWLDHPCLGLGWRPCPKCGLEAAAEAFEARRRELEAWARERRTNVDELLFSDEPRAARHLASAPLRHLESEHLRLCSNAPPLPLRSCDVPEGLFAHLPVQSPRKIQLGAEHYDWVVLKRLEDDCAAFRTVFQNQGRFASAASNYHKHVFVAAPGKYDVFLWNHADPHKVCARKFFGAANDLGVYKHGARITTPLGNHRFTRDDEAVHRYLTHMMNHLLLEAYEYEIGYDFPAWIPEGFAHYMEYRKFGDFQITCFFEKPRPVTIPRKWRSYLLKMVATGDTHPVATLIKMSYNRMDAKAHLQMFSLFHYLVEEAPREKFIRFIAEVKRTRDQMAAFKTAYGYSLLQLDEPWETFVRARYRGR